MTSTEKALQEFDQQWLVGNYEQAHDVARAGLANAVTLLSQIQALAAA